MSNNDDLREHVSEGPEERLARLAREMRGPLERADALATQLSAVDPAQGAHLFRGQFDVLIGILRDSAAKLREVAGSAPFALEKARAVGAGPDEALRTLRHDMLTPLGTLRSVAGMLAKAGGTPGLPPDVVGWAEALVGTLNELKDVLDALTGGSGRGRDEN